MYALSSTDRPVNKRKLIYMLDKWKYVAEMAERLNTMSSVKLARFRSQFEVSYMFNNTEELWYNETFSLWMTIYIFVTKLIIVFHFHYEFFSLIQAHLMEFKISLSLSLSLSIYIYIYIYAWFVGNILKRAKAHFLDTIKGFQVLL